MYPWALETTISGSTVQSSTICATGTTGYIQKITILVCAVKCQDDNSWKDGYYDKGSFMIQVKVITTNLMQCTAMTIWEIISV